MGEMIENRESMGGRLLKLRMQNNMTQEELAERLEVSRQSVSKWELDKTLPDVGRLTSLAKMYDVSMDYLVRGTMPAQPFPKEEQVNIDMQEKKSIGKNKEKIIKTIMFVFCGLLSAVLSIGVFWFAGTIVSSRASDDKQQELVLVDRVIKQYSKAEILGMTKEGDSVKQVVWLDKPGISEGDYIFGYQDINQENKIWFDYYSETILLPIIAGVILLIFSIVFWVGLTGLG